MTYHVTDQIISFKDKDGFVWSKRWDDYAGYIFCVPHTLSGYSIEKILSGELLNGFEIYSVKNSGGVELSIGDDVTITFGLKREYWGKIESFRILDDSVIVAKWGDGYSSDINLLVKKEEPITTDTITIRGDVAGIITSMQPTPQLRWKKYEWNDAVAENQLGFFLSGDHFILEQLWKDSTTGKEEWKPIEVVK